MKEYNGDENKRVMRLAIPSSIAGDRLPKSILQLDALKCLVFRRRTSSIPQWIGDFVLLEELHLSGTDISSLPPSIGSLKALKQLDLRGTKNLMSLPEEIGGLTNLTELHLTHSSIRTLPSTIGGLQMLEKLYLDYTKNLMSLPEEIVCLENLDVLNLGGSNLSSVVKWKLWYKFFNRKFRLHLEKNPTVLWPLFLGNVVTAFEKLSQKTPRKIVFYRADHLKEHDAMHHLLCHNIDLFVDLIAAR